MTILKNLAVTCAIACGLTLQAANAAAEVSPIRADYGNVFPTLTEQDLSVSRSSGPAPWYVSFNLLAEANVALGVVGFPPFDLTSIRIVTINGDNVAFGTDTFTHNPFPNPIEQLAVADHLSAGKYALEVSGAGDRSGADFGVRLQVMPIPEPETYALMLAGLGLVGFMAQRRQRA